MRKILMVVTASILFIACKKEKAEAPPPISSHPIMAYKDLQKKEAKYGQYQYVDVDNDGLNDILFNVILVATRFCKEIESSFMRIPESGAIF